MTYLQPVSYINTLEFLKVIRKTEDPQNTQDQRPTFQMEGYIQNFQNGLLNRVYRVVQDRTAYPS